MHILSLDVGTTSMRGILYHDGHELDSVAVETPIIVGGEFIEQSPNALEMALVSICSFIAKKHHVDALTLTAFRSAPTLVTQEGNALCPFIMWEDTRNKEICEALSPYSDEVFRISGAPINTVFTAGKLAWLKQNRPDLWKQTFKAMVVPDYLINKMTDSFITDYTYGSRSLLMNLATCKWDSYLCNLFNVEIEKLCTLVPQGSIVGKITSSFAAKTGLCAGLPVISAGGDQQCAVLGMGLHQAGGLVVNVGTGAFVMSLVNEPALTNPAIICNVSASPGLYTLEMNVMASASALNYSIRQFFPNLVKNQEMDFFAFDQLVMSSPPGANGVYCLPHFQGCGSRCWNPSARAGFHGLSTSSTREDIARSVYEGIAAEIIKSVDVLPIKHQTSVIRIAGGMSRSDVFVQILADMAGKQVHRAESVQASAFGAYLSARISLDLPLSNETTYPTANEANSVFIPDTNRHALYQKYLIKTEQAFRALISTFN